MEKNRRNFFKKTVTASTLITLGTLSSALANETKEEISSNGVVVGKSKKKEILYKKTSQWDAFYKSSY